MIRLKNFFFRSYSSSSKLFSSFKVTHTLEAFRQEFGKTLSATNVSLSVAGRITAIRLMGKKLVFIDIESGCRNLSSLQIKVSSDVYDISKDEKGFEKDVKNLNRGDIIGVEGKVVNTTKSGELSLIPKKIHLLASCTKIIPSSKVEWSNTQDRTRFPHVDLLSRRNDKRRIFEMRSQILRALRDFFEKRDYLEVETPILSSSYGGGAATPFVTHQIEDDSKRFLRISPELYLKKCVIGGLDKVYEIGKQFRNEGIDSTHSPEFTSMEAYSAYSDYLDFMELTQNLLLYLCQVTNQGSCKLMYQDFEMDLSLKYTSLDFIESLESATGKIFPSDYSSPDSKDFLLDILKNHSLHIPSDPNISRCLDKIFSSLIEPELRLPTFVIDHPDCLSPLAAPHPSKKGRTARFELFIGGLELVNSYSELNDPKLQRQRFASQSTESPTSNDEFVEALEYGLPPTAGWGLGLDRLIMIFTNQSHIRDVILFPFVRQA